MERKLPQSERGQNFGEFEPLLNAQELATRCQVSAKSLHKWAREGRIPAMKFGRLWRFRASAMENFLDRKLG